MLTFSEKITVVCFAASYAVAFVLELWRLFRPRPIERYVSLAFGGAGLFAHVVYMIVQMFVAARPLPLGSPTGSLFFLALILAVFYFYGALHYRRIAWAVFVLPLVLGLIGLGTLLQDPSTPAVSTVGWQHFWDMTHGTLLLLAAVGVCVGFIASVMYLVQLRRVRAKLPPNQGMQMLSLERLEMMNRRAILGAFPLLTAGLLAGITLQLQRGYFQQGWEDPRILSVLGLWIVFAILLYLRYWVHVRGQQLAWWTVAAFVILVLALVSPPHSFAPGGLP